MARPSKLTEKQWAEVTRRVIEGEKVSDLAREFKVSKATISARVSKRAEGIKTLAGQIVSVERALGALPVSEQLLTSDLASRLRSISSNLAAAADYGAATAHRLNALANSEVAKVDDANPLKSLEALRGVTVLTKLANDASMAGFNLLAANKDMVKGLNQDEPEAPVRIVVEVEDASRPEAAT